MKKVICILVMSFSLIMSVISLVLSISLFISTHKTVNEPYVLDYQCGSSSELIMSTDDSGIFYILEEPVFLTHNNGNFNVKSCWHDGDSNLNVSIIVETENVDEFESAANDKNGTLYPVAVIGKSELKRLSYGYELMNSEGNSFVYLLKISYECPSNKAVNPISLTFLEKSFDLKLIDKPGIPLYSNLGTALYERYNNHGTVL